MSGATEAARPLRASTGLLALLLAVAACGGAASESGKPADQILTDAQAAAENASSARAVKLKPQTGPGILYVADDAEHPYPLRIDSTASGGHSAITFSGWGADVTIQPPPGSG